MTLGPLTLLLALSGPARAEDVGADAVGAAEVRADAVGAGEAGAGASGAREAGAADVLTYPIGPGDEVHLTIVNQPEMSGDLRVSTTGELTIPGAASIHIDGMTLDQAKDAITAHLAAGYLRNPQVLLDIKTFASREIAVSGGVQKPDTYSLLSGRTTVSRMLLEAGGLVDASATRAEIWRDVGGVRTVIPVDLEQMRRGDASADQVLLPGDHLTVPEVDQVFVDGQVQKPGVIAFRQGMTLTEAIIQAGSALGTARLRGAYITRKGERIDVNLKRVQRAKDPDVPLLPGDRIYIPESVF